MKEPAGVQDSTETIAVEGPHDAEGRRGPTWRGWVLSILVAVILSVTVALLLGGYTEFRSDNAGGAGMGGGVSRAGHNGCPSADTAK
jgi:hypothetical protein